MPDCPKCGGPMRTYAPWYEPPENRFDQCHRCGHIEYMLDERDFNDEETDTP